MESLVRTLDSLAKPGSSPPGMPRTGSATKRPVRARLLSRAKALGLVYLCFGMGAAAVPPSTQPPGQLAPADTPQIVLLTFDDTVSTSSYSIVQQVLDGPVNPNGHGIKATFFVSLSYNYDFPSIRRLYDAGHEIAVHTMSHATGADSSLTRWRQEIAGAKRTLNLLAGIPEDEIVGFRAPFLALNNDTFRVLAEREFLYDASILEHLSGLSTSPGNLLWPYTLDDGFAQNTPASVNPAARYPGLFEIPLLAQFSNMTAVITTDPKDSFSTAEVEALWRQNFLARYHGNRAPYGIFLHASTSAQWLSNPGHSEERIAALKAFVEWALQMPDTWFITCKDLIGFMTSPVPASEAAAHPSFLTPERTPFPTSEISRCAFPGNSTISVCGACPPAPPTYSNAFLGFVPMSGGAAALNIVSQDSAYAWCELTVSNDTPHRIYDWAVDFSVQGGEPQRLYDVTPTVSAGRVQAAARQYNRQILPGTRRTVTFRLKRSGGEVSLGEPTITASGLGPQPIRLDLQQQRAPPGWSLRWSDNAHLYAVESTTNLLSPEWVTVTNELARPRRPEPHSTDGTPRFYRVKGWVY
jgi:peptidoglycan/xylan/chitin deacetylase (PgdA/CDA1 family)